MKVEGEKEGVVDIVSTSSVVVPSLWIGRSVLLCFLNASIDATRFLTHDHCGLQFE